MAIQTEECPPKCPYSANCETEHGEFIPIQYVKLALVETFFHEEIPKGQPCMPLTKEVYDHFAAIGMSNHEFDHLLSTLVQTFAVIAVPWGGLHVFVYPHKRVFQNKVLDLKAAEENRDARLLRSTQGPKKGKKNAN